MAQQLTEKGKQKITNIRLAIGGVSILSGIGGVIYSNKTGGGFWRGVGYYLLVSIVVAIPLNLLSMPVVKKTISEETLDDSGQYKLIQYKGDDGGYQ